MFIKKKISTLKNINKKNRNTLIFFSSVLLIVGTIAVLVLKNPQKVEAGWWNNNWLYRKKLTIDNTKVSGSTDFTDFTVVVQLTDTDLAAKAQSNGADIIFTDLNGVKLPHEITSYNSGTGALTAWIKVKTLFAGEDTHIFMYYGNASYTNQQDAKDAWDENYRFVYHLEETTTGDTDFSDSGPMRFDSSAVTIDGSGNADITGVIGNAVDFDNNDDIITTTYRDGSADGITISAWYKKSADATSDYGTIVAQADYDGSWYINSQIYINKSNNRIGFWKDAGGTNGNWESASDVIFDETWHHIVVTYDDSNLSNDPQLYIDGSGYSWVTNTNPTVEIYQSEWAWTIGRNEKPTQQEPAAGTIDEVSLQKTIRSSDWITTTYNNQDDPAGFFSTTGSEEIGPGAVVYFKFDEGYGTTANDNSSSGNDGTIVSAEWQSEALCMTGKCLWYDGSEDEISIADDTSLDFDGSGSFTVQTWVKHKKVTSGTETIASKYESTGSDGGFKIYFSGSGDITFGIDDENTSFPEDSVSSSTADYDDNDWHLVTAVKTGVTSIKLYLDGKLIDTDSSLSATGNISNNDPMYIASLASSSDFFEGFIDEFVIYPYARTTAEISNDYESQKTSPNSTATSAGAKPDATIQNGLVGYWKMNDGTGTSIVDYAGNKSTGTLTNSPSWGSGKFGAGVQFHDGSSDQYVRIQNTNLDDLEQFSYSFWTKLSSLSSNKYWISKGNSSSNMGIYIDANYRPQFTRSFSGTTLSVNLAAGEDAELTTDQWYHIVVTYDGSINKSGTHIYIDGDEKAHHASAVDGVGTKNTDAPYLNLGNSIEATDQIPGSMGEVRLYNRTLTSAEVENLYNWAPGPVGYWDFNENTGTTANDKSTNDNNLDLFVDNSDGYPEWVHGKYGSGIAFDGSGNHLETSADSSLLRPTYNMTAEAWVKLDQLPTETGSDEYILVKSHGSSPWESWALSAYEYSGQNRFRFNWKNDSGTDYYVTTKDVLTLEKNKWYHLAAIRDGAKIILYVNGVNKVGSSSLPTASDTLYVSVDILQAGSEGSTKDLDGIMDEVRVYDYARTQKQIIEDMNAGNPAPSSPIGSYVSYWNMDEASGTTAYDKSQSNNNLTLNTAYWTLNGKYHGAWNGNGSGWLSRADDVDFDFDSTDDLTITMWFKSDSATNPSSTEYILSKETSSAGYAIYAETDGNIVFAIDDDATWGPEDAVGDAGSDYYDGNWHHLAAVKSGTSAIKIYIDSILEENDTSLTATGSLANSATIYIGDRDGSNNGDEFNGNLDDIKIYRSALTKSQIAIDMNQGISTSFGALSTDGTGANSNASSKSFCVPGSSDTCRAPISYWPLNENSATSVADKSGNGHNSIAFSGDTTWVIGKIGSALDLDGTDDSVQFADSDDFSANNTNELTVEAWIKPDTLSTTQSIVSKSQSGNYEWSLRLHGDGTLNGYLYNSVAGNFLEAQSLANLEIGKWYHVALVANVTTPDLKVYVDGQIGYLEDTTSSGTYANGTAPVKIGETADGNNDFNGSIDDVKIYDYARTQAQIAWDYNRGSPMAHYKFDECQGTTIFDTSKNTDNGVLTIGTSGGNISAGSCESNTSTEAWNNGSSGKINSSISLDGTDDYIINNNVTLPTDDLTVMAWMYLDTINNDRTILMASDSGTANELMLMAMADDGGNANSLRGTIDGTSTYSSQQKLYTGSWYHIAMTRENSTIKLYVNGTQDPTTGTDSSTLNFNSCPLYIGTDADSGCTGALSDYFDGKIDDVRIYNYALTDTQIKTTINQGAVHFN